jgi:pilus assembly protein CpaB
MRMKSLILIFIALGCGLVASIGISQVMDRSGSGGSTMEMEQILVAAAEINQSSELDDKNIKLEDWPKAKVPEGAIRRLDDAVGKFALSRFYSGEPIMAAKIAEEPGGVTTQIPEGYRAMPVKVEEDTVMKGISPGDRVDVLVFLRRNGDEIPETGVYPILRNVRVFATNANTERAVDSKGSESNFRTVSLLVQEKHAGELVMAAQMGKISLTLRRPEEKDEQAGEEVTPMAEILAGQSKIDAPAVAAAPPANDFHNLLNSTAQNPAAAASEWRLDIRTPNGVEQWDWPTKDGLPVRGAMLSAGDSAGGAAPPPATPAQPIEPTNTSEPEEPSVTPESSFDGDQPPSD